MVYVSCSMETPWRPTLMIRMVLFDLNRRAVGGQVTVGSALDIHANISELMTSTVDVLVGYRKNPHIDMLERGVEAARVSKENTRRYVTRKICN